MIHKIILNFINGNVLLNPIELIIAIGIITITIFCITLILSNPDFYFFNSNPKKELTEKPIDIDDKRFTINN